MSKTGCEKCDFTGFSYGKIPCVCVVDAPPKEDGTIFIDRSKYAPHINGVPLQPNGNDIDIDNQYKPDNEDSDNAYGCLNLTFPAHERDFQIMRVSPESGKIIEIGAGVFYNNMFVGRALRSAKAGGLVEVSLSEGGIYTLDSSDPHLTFEEQSVKHCPECGHTLD